MHQNGAVPLPGNIFQRATPAAKRGAAAEEKDGEGKFGSHEDLNAERTKKLRCFVAFNKAEPRFRIEFPAVEFTAAIEAGDGACESPDAREILAASGTTIKEPAGALFDRERKGMAARFISDAEIAAGLAPGSAMRWNAPPTGAELGQQMRQLMA